MAEAVHPHLVGALQHKAVRVVGGDGADVDGHVESHQAGVGRLLAFSSRAAVGQRLGRGVVQEAPGTLGRARTLLLGADDLLQRTARFLTHAVAFARLEGPQRLLLGALIVNTNAGGHRAAVVEVELHLFAFLGVAGGLHHLWTVGVGGGRLGGGGGRRWPADVARFTALGAGALQLGHHLVVAALGRRRVRTVGLSGNGQCQQPATVRPTDTGTTI